MEQLRQSRLASLLTVLVGIWIMISPIFISITGGALVSLLITGGVMIVFGLIQMVWKNSLPSWINALASIWLFLSALTFSVSAAVVWNQVIFAVVGFVLATWDGTEMGAVHRSSGMHHTPA